MIYSYSLLELGSKYSSTYKVYITESSKVISPFHDISTFDGDYVNAVNEIPRFENAKFEISKEKEFNPIVQDTKNGRLRFIPNVFPSHGYLANYGAIPQTWEDPQKDDIFCKAKGDNDPLDCIEIGTKIKKVGEVYKGKVLGCLGLLDKGETDWKVVLIDITDKFASEINDIKDVDRYFPNLLQKIFEWFRDYKKPDENKFAFNGEWQNAEFAEKIIKKAHDNWINLMENGYKDICLSNSLVGFNNMTEPPKLEEEAYPPTPKPNDALEFSYL